MRVRMVLTLDVDEEQWRSVFSEPTPLSDLEPVDVEVRGFLDGYLSSMSSVRGAIRGFEIEPVPFTNATIETRDGKTIVMRGAGVVIATDGPEIWRSEDYGQTWTRIWRSEDYGQTWTRQEASRSTGTGEGDEDGGTD